jgi:phosphoribosylanthranilate isomerase
MSIIKICGLSTPETLEAAIRCGADWVGFVRFARSPRHVSLTQGAALSEQAKGRAVRVLLLVDASEDEIEQAVEAMDPDILQLHGSEDPNRVSTIRTRFGRPVMKAVGISQEADLSAVSAHRAASDHLLLDAKPPSDMAALPGGNGIAFDWRILAALDPATAFMLSGGLDPANVTQAISLSRPMGVDVSSGVEASPGVKDPAKIAEFIEAARAAFVAPYIKGGQA